MNHLALAGALACLVIVVARWLLVKGGKKGGKVKATVKGLPEVAVSQRDVELTTHDYVTTLHEKHGNIFCDSTPREPGASGRTEPVVYSSNGNTASFVLLKNKLFAPVRCPDSAFKSFQNKPDVKCRSPFDLVQPMAKGTVFDLTGDAWKARKACLASLFVSAPLMPRARSPLPARRGLAADDTLAQMGRRSAHVPRMEKIHPAHQPQHTDTFRAPPPRAHAPPPPRPAAPPHRLAVPPRPD